MLSLKLARKHHDLRLLTGKIAPPRGAVLSCARA
jgi:hypothetical protein